LNKPVLWNLFKSNPVHKYFDEDGSLRIKIEFSTHVLRSSDEQTCLAEEDAVVASVLEETVRDNIARSVAALLEDEKNRIPEFRLRTMIKFSEAFSVILKYSRVS